MHRMVNNPTAAPQGPPAGSNIGEPALIRSGKSPAKPDSSRV